MGRSNNAIGFVFFCCIVLFLCSHMLFVDFSRENHHNLPLFFVGGDGEERDGNVLPTTLIIQRPRTPHISFNEEGDTIYKASEDAPIIKEDEVTVLIKTMDRPTCLRNLVAGIREQHPTISIIVADDGVKSSAKAVSKINNVMFFRMLYDSGLSSGRNLMLSQVTTQYVLLLDDDFLWDKSILQYFIRVMQLHPHLDLVGGRAGLNFAGIMHVRNDTLFLVKGNKGILEDTSIPAKPKHDGEIGEMGPPCVLVDFVPNFFLGRTDSLLKLQWDNNLKVGEHEEFFLRFNRGNFKVAYCPDLYVENQQDKCNDATQVDGNEARKLNRARALAFIKKGLNIHNLSKLAYCLGEGFASVAWNLINGPFDEVCHEVPLPESCPLGRMGSKCDQCAPGFTGPQCDQCLPNHFDRNCEPCLCEHGTCVVVPDANDHLVRCKCESGWYGMTCNTPLLLGSNLILDPTFNSLRSTEPSASLWRLYKDGCVNWADNGVWLMNDGHKQCGAFYVVELNQNHPRTIVISVETKGVGIVALPDPAAYSLYVDLQFQDGEMFYAQFLGFPEGTHGLQYKELIIPKSKAVRLATVHVLLKTGGNAFFHEISVRQEV